MQSWRWQWLRSTSRLDAWFKRASTSGYWRLRKTHECGKRTGLGEKNEGGGGGEQSRAKKARPGTRTDQVDRHSNGGGACVSRRKTETTARHAPPSRNRTHRVSEVFLRM